VGLRSISLALLVALFAWICFIAAGFAPTQEKKSHAPGGPAAKRFPVHIRTPEGPPSAKTAHPGADGKPATIRCATCHAMLVPNDSTTSGEQLKAFHQGLKFKHGQLTCVSCHHAEDYDSLRAADNRKIPFARVMDLCAQCHGPQARDYQHGAHGGMTGFWDLKRGPRQRNNCIDCHDPHHPAYPRVQPVFAPKDRFPPVHGGSGKGAAKEGGPR
jgi:hypothetical protein